MYCRQCGAENADGAKFCADCGKPLVGAPNNSADGQKTERYIPSPAAPSHRQDRTERVERKDAQHPHGQRAPEPGKRRDPKKYAVAGAIVAALVFACVGVAVANSGVGSETEPEPVPASTQDSSSTVSSDSDSAVAAGAGSVVSDGSSEESPAGYGTSAANIANGGYVAYANGKTYCVGNGTSNVAGSMYQRTAIASYDTSISHRKVLYKAGSQKYKDSSGKTATSQKTISCLHVTDDALVFCEQYWKSSSDPAYDIVQTDLDGSNRQVLVVGNDVKGAPNNLANCGAFMWVDNGNIYYVDKQSLWSQSLAGGDKAHVLELENGETYAVADGIVYYSKDSGTEVEALEINTGATTNVYSGDRVEGVSSSDGAADPLTTDEPRAVSIQPEGDRVYLGMKKNLDSTLSGFVSINRDGADGKYYSGLTDSKKLTGGMAFIVHDGVAYFVYGKNSAAAGGVAIVKFDPNSGDQGESTTIYETDGVDVDNDGAIGNWLAVGKDRLFFQSKGSTDISSIGTRTTEQDYDRGTPWSVNLDGSDLARGTK